jgi:probable rRNA maturation factor
VTLSLSVQFASKSKSLPLRAQVRRWALAAHAVTDADHGVVTIRYVDEIEARELNRQFRRKDYATNVLTFPFSEPDRAPPIRYAADIVICAPVIAREAKEQKKTAREHHAHMVVHGMLHAQGFDHENKRDANVMESREVAILARFRIKNPYES